MEEEKVINYIVESTKQLYFSSTNSTHLKKKDNNLDEWDFVPSSKYFIKRVKDILEKENINENDIISDLGCGISPLLIYLNILGYKKLRGFDNELLYLKILKTFNISLLREIKTYNCNLLKLDRKQKDLIKDSKVIYMYMPITNIKRFYNLLLKIWNLMEKDSILISFYAMENFDLINKKYYISIENSSFGYYKK